MDSEKSSAEPIDTTDSEFFVQSVSIVKNLHWLRGDALPVWLWLCAKAARAGRDRGTVSGSLRAIAADIHCGAAAVHRGLSVLIDHGWIAPTLMANGSGVLSSWRIQKFKSIESFTRLRIARENRSTGGSGMHKKTDPRADQGDPRADQGDPRADQGDPRADQGFEPRIERAITTSAHAPVEEERHEVLHEKDIHTPLPPDGGSTPSAPVGVVAPLRLKKPKPSAAITPDVVAVWEVFVAATGANAKIELHAAKIAARLRERSVAEIQAAIRATAALPWWRDNSDQLRRPACFFSSAQRLDERMAAVKSAPLPAPSPAPDAPGKQFNPANFLQPGEPKPGLKDCKCERKSFRRENMYSGHNWCDMCGGDMNEPGPSRPQYSTDKGVSA